MKATYLLVLCFVLGWPLAAQFTDDFSATTLADHWLGDVGKFSSSGGQLGLNDLAPAANNTAVLYALVPTSTAEETTWSLTLRCDFSPSTSNVATVYLATDQPPLPGAALNGYYLRVGGITGSDDALQLFRQDGTASTLLLSGTLGAVANDPVVVSVLVRRTVAGEWFVEADYAGGEDYNPEGSIVDATYAAGQYFGLLCRYTSTRGTAFFFDNVFVDPIVVDTDAPVALSAAAQTATGIVVQFNEPLADASVATPTRFSVNNGIGAAQTAAFVDGDRSRVALTFANPLANLTDYLMTIVDATDLAGNVAATQTLGFSYFLPETPRIGDLIFTEILPDPTPVVGLPDAEYVEIFNASNKVLQLGGVTLSTGSSPRAVDNYVLLPQAYVILCGSSVAAEFAAFGEVAMLSSFPALTNGGSDLILANAQGEILTALRYDLTWYQDNLKAEGGYAMELIDPALPNDCPGNWRASLATAGGTPGQPNSVLGATTDATAPNVLTAYADNATTVSVTFDDVLDRVADVLDLFTITPAIGISDVLLSADGRQITLFLGEPLAENTVYEVAVAAGIADCLGNATPAAVRIQVGLAVVPQVGDLIINEVLFNPVTGGSDYLELYNPTQKIVNLRGLRMRNDLLTSGTTSATFDRDYIVLPGTYVVLTPDRLNVLENYTVPNPGALLQNTLPSMADDEGNITILNPALEVLDALTYSDEWHSSLLSDENGVSLERLRADAATQNQGNWFSAATAAGYGTPTGPNSQNRQDIPTPEEDAFFQLVEGKVSPDGDGFQDVLELSYTTDRAGYVAQLRIFDAQGRPVAQTNKLELLAGAGTVIWDGTTTDGKRARIGIYVLMVELFTPQGETVQEKHPFVVAGDLD
jgi:hypothetical protein